MKITVKMGENEVTLDDEHKGSLSHLSTMEIAVYAISAIIKALKEHEKEEFRSE